MTTTTVAHGLLSPDDEMSRENTDLELLNESEMRVNTPSLFD